MLFNLISFFCGILFFGLIVLINKRREEKERAELVMVAFEKKNEIIKATTATGGVFWSNESSIRANPKNWWQQGNKNRPGVLEESLTHLYFTNELKKVWEQSMTPSTQPPPVVVKPTKFN